MKLFKVKFVGVYPVGNCLIIIAEDIKEARDIAEQTISHTDDIVVERVLIDKSKVIVYLSGDY